MGHVEGLIATLYTLIFLSSYSSRLGLIDQSFSIALGDVSNGATMIKGPVGYALAVSSLSPSGKSRVLAHFRIESKSNIVLISGGRCDPKRAFRCSFGTGGQLSFSFVPTARKRTCVIVKMTDRLIAQSSDVGLGISDPRVGVHFRGIPSLVLMSRRTRFCLRLSARLCKIGTSTEFMGKDNQICVSKCSTAENRNITLRGGGLIAFQPSTAKRTIVRFAISDHCNLPIGRGMAVRMGR